MDIHHKSSLLRWLIFTPVNIEHIFFSMFKNISEKSWKLRLGPRAFILKHINKDLKQFYSEMTKRFSENWLILRYNFNFSELMGECFLYLLIYYYFPDRKNSCNMMVTKQLEDRFIYEIILRHLFLNQMLEVNKWC